MTEVPHLIMNFGRERSGFQVSSPVQLSFSIGLSFPSFGYLRPRLMFLSRAPVSSEISISESSTRPSLEADAYRKYMHEMPVQYYSRRMRESEREKEKTEINNKNL